MPVRLALPGAQGELGRSDVDLGGDDIEIGSVEHLLIFPQLEALLVYTLADLAKIFLGEGIAR